MKISIVIPVYKVEKYLNQCVDSVLGQDYKDLEVILVDDGSPDSCPQICDDYAERDNRVRVIHNINGGASDARNTGIKAATGDYICFLDSDDYWDDSSALNKIAASIKEHNSDICQYFHRVLIETDNLLMPYQFRKLESMNGMEIGELLEKTVSTNNVKIAAWSNAISRKFLLENDLFFIKGKKVEDLEWAIRMYLCRPKISFIDDVFYIYRKNRVGSVTASIDYKHLCDYCDLLESCVFLVENGSADLKYPLMSYLMYHSLIVSALCYRVELSKVQRKEILQRIKTICKDRIENYCLDPKVTLAKKIYKVFGFSAMAKVVGFYLNNRKK